MGTKCAGTANHQRDQWPDAQRVVVPHQGARLHTSCGPRLTQGCGRAARVADQEKTAQCCFVAREELHIGIHSLTRSWPLLRCHCRGSKVETIAKRFTIGLEYSEQCLQRFVAWSVQRILSRHSLFIDYGATCRRTHAQGRVGSLLQTPVRPDDERDFAEGGEQSQDQDQDGVIAALNSVKLIVIGKVCFYVGVV